MIVPKEIAKKFFDVGVASALKPYFEAGFKIPKREKDLNEVFEFVYLNYQLEEQVRELKDSKQK